MREKSCLDQEQKPKKRNRKAKEQNVNSLDFPVDMVSIIMKNLNPKKAVTLSRVNRSWREAAKDVNPALGKTPWLLQTCYSSSGTRHLINAADTSKVFKIRVRDVVSTCCIGSKDGWLALESHDSRNKCQVREVFLYNPFSRARMDLPEVKDVNHVIMSSSPQVPGCVILAILLDETILLWRPGARQRHWTEIAQRCCWRGNAVCFEQKVFFLNLPNSSSGIIEDDHDKLTVELIELVGSEAIRRELSVAVPPKYTVSTGDYWMRYWTYRLCCYLVESKGQLLLVDRSKKFVDFSWQCDIRVYQLDLSKKVWIEMEKLDDRAVLLQNFGGFTVSAKETGLQESCIYYNNSDYHFDSAGWFEYNMKSRETRKCSVTKDMPLRSTQKVWIIPSMI